MNELLGRKKTPDLVVLSETLNRQIVRAGTLWAGGYRWEIRPRKSRRKQVDYNAARYGLSLVVKEKRGYFRKKKTGNNNERV